MAGISEADGYVYAGGRLLRRGYTTGSCAAAASGAAASVALGLGVPESVKIVTPRGIEVDIPVVSHTCGDGWAVCSVRKDGGDDADDTNGLLIESRVTLSSEPGVRIDGGIGVGRVTRRGLDQPVGNAAINRVPRSMIAGCVSEALGKAGFAGGADVVISVPDGERVGARTFNPRLGIVGGISILGTSGIVDPMSEKALVDSIRAETKVFMGDGRKTILTVPGNYGKDFVKAYPALADVQPVECSNFIGELLDAAVEFGAEGILLVGNLGKLVKVAGGIMNTHSRCADSRMEILCSNALLAGADPEICRRIMGCVSTDDALELLSPSGMIGPTMEVLLPKIEAAMSHRVRGEIRVGAIAFSSEFGILGETPGASELVEMVRDRK